MEAAEKLNTEIADIAINWSGGLHHAKVRLNNKNKSFEKKRQSIFIYLTINIKLISDLVDLTTSPVTPLILTINFVLILC